MERLVAKGWQCDVVEAYVTRRATVPPEVVERALCAEAITFASASAVTAWMALAGRAGGAVICIGPVTAEAAAAAGLEVGAVASPHTIEGLAAATIQHLGGPPW